MLWQTGRGNMNKSYTYQDEHASIHLVDVHSMHVVNAQNTYKHKMVYIHATYKLMEEKVGRELSSIVEQLSGYTVCS